MKNDMVPQHCDGNVTRRISKDAPKEARFCYNMNIITVSTFSDVTNKIIMLSNRHLDRNNWLCCP